MVCALDDIEALLLGFVSCDNGLATLVMQEVSLFLGCSWKYLGGKCYDVWAWL